MLHFINRCNDLIRHDMSCVCARKKLEDVAKTQGCMKDGVCLELLKCQTAENEGDSPSQTIKVLNCGRSSKVLA